MSTEEPATTGGSSRWVDRTYLRNDQYVDATNFAARQAIYAYQQPRVRLYDWALDFAGLTGDETILDVGCGNGGYLRTLHRRGHSGLTIGMDFSAGMLHSAREGAGARPSQPLVQGDAAALPVASGTVGVGLAMHMLYHVPDRGRALAELRRVIADDGCVLIVLNGPGHSAELLDLVRQGLARSGRPVPPSIGGLDLDAGERLASTYFSVERHEVAAQLVVTEPQPVVDYARSMRFIRPGGSDEQDLLGFVNERVSAAIAAEGAFRIATASGCLVCR